MKEQLKKMGSFEYYHTSFSYTASGDRRGAVRRRPRAGRPRSHLVRPARPRHRLHARASRRTARLGFSGSRCHALDGTRQAASTAGGVAGA